VTYIVRIELEDPYGRKPKLLLTMGIRDDGAGTYEVRIQDDGDVVRCGQIRKQQEGTSTWRLVELAIHAALRDD